MHALFVYNSNPGAVAPNQNAVRRGMARADLFTVVHELFFTDTTDYADYVLPATTFLEHTDIQGAYGHYFVQLSQQAIEPPGEARSNVWLFGQLAQRMGFTEECFRDTPEEMIRQALAIGPDGHSTNPGMEHITFEDALKREGHIPLGFHRRRAFSLLLRVRWLRRRERSSFIRRRWRRREWMAFRRLFLLRSRGGANGASSYPLEFLGRKADNYMNSTFANLDGHRKMEARTSQRLEMHPEDAEARGIADGDAVRVWNERGSIESDGDGEWKRAGGRGGGAAGLGQAARGRGRT